MQRKITAIAAAVMFGFAGSAFAVTFDSLDKDGDGQVNKEEFVDSGLFSLWDNDNDGKLAEDETAQDWSTISDWDDDDSGYLDEDEFYDNAWSDWDADDDDYLDEDDWDEVDEDGWFDV